MRSFVRIDARTAKNTKYGGSSKDVLILRPTFHTTGKDIMKKGTRFFAALDPNTNMWSTNETTVYDVIDAALNAEKKKREGMVGEDGFSYDKNGNRIIVESIDLNTTRVLDEYRRWINCLPENFNYKPLDNEIVYKDQVVEPEDYCSKRLPYNLSDSDCPSYNELMSTLYDEDNRRKIEWLIGSVFAGDSDKIEKMGVLYGKPGTGKSTVLDIIKDLFEGYWAVFSSEHLANKNKDFATAYFKDNPLVAIEDDGSMTKIDSPTINEIISHKLIMINEKGIRHYPLKPRSVLFMATNDVVDLNNEMGGMSRRLLDIYPTNNKIPVSHYRKLVKNIKYELGAIANHCLKVYESMGSEYYLAYRPQNMINKSSYLRNFIMDEYDFLIDNDPISKADLFNRYIKYVEDSKIPYPLTRIKFSEQILSYYNSYEARYETPSKVYRNVFIGFKGLDSLSNKVDEEEDKEDNYIWLHLDKTKSKFDRIGKDFKAQYVIYDKKLGEWRPAKKWENVTTTLSDIDTTKEHYAELPLSHIIFDFDLKNPDTKEKDPELNIKAASHYPATYAEFSKSGAGIHLHYIYKGDASKLANKFTDEWGNEVEIKHCSNDGNTCKIRRKLTYCNDLNIAEITGGLPEKEKKTVALDKEYVMNEKKLLSMIERCLKKEFGSTTQCINFIDQLLNEADASGNPYCVPLELRKRILAFANNSTNQADKCVKTVANMKWESEKEQKEINHVKKDQIIFFDIEVFPNFFCLCYKLQGEENPVVKLINPSGDDLRPLLDYKLVGFNNKNYDNHILYAKITYNYSNSELYSLSKDLISSKKGSGVGFPNAKYLSYTDVLDFSTKKQSLKAWETDLDITHIENSYPWDEDLPEAAWNEVADYCANDVIATEKVFDHLKSDFVAREILSDLSGLSVNDSTNAHTTRIIVGNNKNAYREFIYTHLDEYFPGYKFEAGKSIYKGVEVGEGGYVYAEPGCYTNVALLDIASMHPSSIIALNLFGPYTKNFKDIVDARIAIKHKDFDKARKMLGGKLSKYLDDPENVKNLSQALKIPINSVYGMTSSKNYNFALRDPRNKDNIVAKRGALFMVDLQEKVKNEGYTVAHIKTDSIKIPDATPSIIKLVMDYGKEWGYNFEHEATYKRMCLINKSTYIALYANNEEHEVTLSTGEKVRSCWTPTGTQFLNSYVFKTLFGHQDIIFKDLKVTNQVKSKMYLDFNEDLPEEEHNYHFVGKISSFCPVKEGCGGGLLVKTMEKKDGSIGYDAVTGSKGYRWKEAEVIKANGLEDQIDFSYFDNLVDAAKKEIEKYTDFDWFADPNSDNELVPFK